MYFLIWWLCMKNYVNMKRGKIARTNNSNAVLNEIVKLAKKITWKELHITRNIYEQLFKQPSRDKNIKSALERVVRDSLLEIS